MDEKGIVKICKEAGCCDTCCLRFLGLKNPNVYEDVPKHIAKFLDQPPPELEDQKPDLNGTHNGSPQPKRRKTETCVTCLGVLQPSTWPEACDMVKEVLEKKRYECERFACALSAPMSTMLRERVVALAVQDKFTEFNYRSITPLKEAWKWSFGGTLSAHLSMSLDSGAICPLLITVSVEYPDDLQELEMLKVMSPDLFHSRSKQRRFTVEFTRRSVEQALEGATYSQLQVVELGADVRAARCVSVTCSRSPLYLAGRYIKLSRSLPQTPWLVQGKRMMESSVQEVIFEPLVKLFEMAPEDADHRLKFMSAGREDVDVRCLGNGRPFAVEITDPRRELTESELQHACAQISGSGTVVVKSLVHIPREHLVQLKKGEEMKRKTYDALCVKLTHAPGDDTSKPPQVTPTDIVNINKYRNTAAQSEARIQITQRTPLRVLHRRPLLTRTRSIYTLAADTVPDHPALFTVRLQTEAGTYVKEWAHAELGRTAPALRDALAARTDILALDVADVHLQWPVL